jgi:hypothetical protein
MDVREESAGLVHSIDVVTNFIILLQILYFKISRWFQRNKK